MIQRWFRTFFTALFAIAIVLSTGGEIFAQEETASIPRPNEGWTLHIDAKRHFPSNRELVAHHYCKQVSGGMFQCLLFTSDDPDARLVGEEVIVDPATYQSFGAAERVQWHYHKEEIPKVDIKLPDTPVEQQAEIIQSLENTYGKIYLLWDPGKTDRPEGKPTVALIDGAKSTGGLGAGWSVIVAIIVFLALSLLFGRWSGNARRE